MKHGVWERVGVMCRFLPVLLAMATAPAWAAPAAGSKVPAEVGAALARGESRELIVLLDDGPVEAELAGIRAQSASPADEREAVRRRLALKSARYGEMKGRLAADLAGERMEVVREYSHLPLFFARVGSARALERLAGRAEVKGVFPNEARKLQLTESLPLIGQPPAAAAGFRGIGTSVAVFDTGVDYTRPAFGSCTAPGTPAGCKVIVSFDTAPDDIMRDDATLHGTNVAAIVLGVAPDTRIIAIDVFTQNLAYDADIIEAANWVIANRYTYNIVAINLSLGGGSFSSPCTNTPYNTLVNQVRSAGITPVAASGNDGNTSAIVAPACIPGVISVGAVHDSFYGTFHGTTCTESAAPDKVACFSNSAYFLTLLAPGAIITAAGETMAGTSQATPHVAGAVAVLRSAFPAESLDAIQARLTSTGKPVTDSRNGVTTPRINVAAAIGPPANDLFSAAQALPATAGQITGVNLNATRETGEPVHAGVAGGASVWWTWQGQANGTLSLDTHGSSFDTLLAVYTGESAGSLAPVAANDNDGSAGGASGLTFAARAGQVYRIAVDGRNRVTGRIVLNRNFTPSATADIAVAASGAPSTSFVGELVTYTVSVINYGPETATEVTVTDPIPAGATFVSASPGCALSGSTVTCNVGTLAVGGSISYAIVLSPTLAGTLSNTFQAAGFTNDPAPGNNASAVYTPVAAFVYPVLVDNVQYPMLQNGFDIVREGGVVMATASLFTEQLLLSRAVRFTLQGGYDTFFTSATGYTTLQGSLTLAKGAVTVDRLIVR
ncbi:S8 family serine peptidase [Geobacter sp. 60473]|uniref:S8 family serine peptidase n=2 Tax=Geobacter TaxID=28231 RepID=UPI0025738E1D|nr:S8 family serine peptidase [Geobacter sulfurreducens]BET58956.1 S8 family serine peptidase [Geobacter sp. 60473]